MEGQKELGAERTGQVVRPAAPAPILGTQLLKQQSSIPALAQSRGSILICGEEGVGKSLFAAHIHAASPWSSKPLLSVNVATASEREQRLALFGADFSQLTSTRRSLLEQENVVVIKHIDHAPTWLQDELAAASSTGSFQRPGSVKATRVACRLIFTLRASPEDLHKTGRLSTSLCSLLWPIPRLILPPLRDRPDDIIAIAEDALGSDLAPELREILLSDRWRANVAELKAYLAYLRPLSCEDGINDECHRELAKVLLRIEAGEEASLNRSISLIENNLIAYALRRTRGHRARAARLLGIPDSTLRWRIERSRNLS